MKSKPNLLLILSFYLSTITFLNANSIGNCFNLLSSNIKQDIESYQDEVNRIIQYVTEGEYKGKTFDTLARLVDTFPHRMGGSGKLESAIDYMLDESRKAGLENVRTEYVDILHWERHNESAWMVSPRVKELSFLGLGSSVGTPKGGIRAEVLVVNSFNELKKKGHKAQGKIVVFNSKFKTYAETALYRLDGASIAARYGAVATLIRSVTQYSLDTPHTGWQDYFTDAKKIPTGCITMEDAEMLARLQERGEKIEIHLTMNAFNYPNTTSRNVIAEVQGRESPQEIVVVSGHLDSWDVGQGAMDDGGGVMISWNAAVVLKKLGLRPRRTLQVGLWTSEEQAFYGGIDYYNTHVSKKDNYQLMMESDRGTFNPRGISFTGSDESTCIMREILKLMKLINATELNSPAIGVPDIRFWHNDGVPLAGLINDNKDYFIYHHSPGDTMSMMDTAVLDKCLALWTAVSYVVADMPHRLPHGSSRKVHQHTRMP